MPSTVITEQLIDYIRMATVHSGGITHLKKVASLAEMYHVLTGCHGATDLSPVSLAAALHFDISVNNFGIQEYMLHTKETDEVFPALVFLQRRLPASWRRARFGGRLQRKARGDIPLRTRVFAHKSKVGRHNVRLVV